MIEYSKLEKRYDNKNVVTHCELTGSEVHRNGLRRCQNLHETDTKGKTQILTMVPHKCANNFKKLMKAVKQFIKGIIKP